MIKRTLWLALAALLPWTGFGGTRPVAKDGHVLNLDFETGDLKDWTATGNAFDGQPIRGDVVKQRRSDMASEHTGEYWIGGFEKVGDDGKGTLTSAPFKIDQPWASFRVGGGPWPEVRVELVEAATSNVFFKISGYEGENLRPVVVDIRPHQGKEMFIRLVDDRTGHWGHLNFDDFQFHSVRPQVANELTIASVERLQPPPADVVPFAGLTPAEAVEKAKLPPGFKLHLFAGEPDVVQPIAFCQDHRGRIWVAEGLSYPRRRAEGEGLDRILCFEDTDGDHHFDRRTVVATNLNLVSGLEWGFGGLWVGAAPYLMFIPIADGDSPKLAGPPQILLDGWNYTADTHETLNTLSWGPDGWLYGCHGVFCPSHVGKPGAPESQRQWVDAAVWRYHPVKRQFEVFTEGGSNPWGIDFDEHGEIWAEMCVIPHLFHMVQGARMLRQGGEHFCVGPEETSRNAKYRDTSSRKPIFPHVYEDIQTVADHRHWAGGAGPHAANGRSDAMGGGHAHAGMMCYLGTSWPEEYRGKLIIGNIHGQRLNMDIPVRSGSGYVGKHGEDFLNFNDTWSQTLNQRYDQDGSVFIIDWYDKNQCHHTREDGHDRSNGRIYKIVYNDQKTTPVDLTKLTDEQLVALVPSKNEWMSRHARRVLQERVAKAAESETPGNVPPGFEALAKIYSAGRKVSAFEPLRDLMLSEKPVEARLRALWTLYVNGALTLEDASRLVDDKDEWMRAWVVQVFTEESALWFREEDGKVSGVGEAALDSFKQLAKSDPSPVVRRYLASALQRVPAKLRWDVLTELAQHREDIGDHNLPLMYWYAAEGSVATDPERGLQLLRSSKIPKLREFIARRLAALSLASR